MTLTQKQTNNILEKLKHYKFEVITSENYNEEEISPEYFNEILNEVLE